MLEGVIVLLETSGESRPRSVLCCRRDPDDPLGRSNEPSLSAVGARHVPATRKGTFGPEDAAFVVRPRLTASTVSLSSADCVDILVRGQLQNFEPLPVRSFA